MFGNHGVHDNKRTNKHSLKPSYCILTFVRERETAYTSVSRSVQKHNTNQQNPPPHTAWSADSDAVLAVSSLTSFQSSLFSLHNSVPIGEMAAILYLIIFFCCTILFGSRGAVARATEIDFNYPAVFNFGDSNSDTGGRVASGLESISPPYGQTFFGRPSGRFCDGRLIVDFLMDAMDLPFLNAYLQSVGAPSFQRGTNFAAAGCTILPAKPTSVSPFSFGIQFAQFLQFKSQVLLLLDASKSRRYIPQGDFFAKGLYMFDIGQNDLAGSFYSMTEDQVAALIPTILLEFETGLKELHDEGARNFWIHNTGPLGCLTQNVAFFGKDPSKLDKDGCVAAHNRVARLFNLQLHALCTKLRGQFSDSNIIYVDVYSIKSDLISNYAKYGFEYPITACCGYGGGKLNYDSRVPCGHTEVLNGVGPVTAKGCNDTSEHINWDGIHYTEAANFHVASRILTGKYSDPPFSDKMPFLIKPKY